MARPVFATEFLPQRSRIHNHLGLAVGIHLLRGRKKHEVGPPFPKQRQVLLQIPGVSIEVLSGTELKRIHKDGNGQEVRPLPGQFHQGEMTLMEGPHRGNQAQTEAFLPDGLQRPREVLSMGGEYHVSLEKLCSGPG
jgi:hypothetical protein